MDSQFVSVEFPYELVINSDNHAHQQKGKESEVLSIVSYLADHNKTYCGIALNGI